MLTRLLILAALAATVSFASAQTTDNPPLTPREIAQGYRDGYVLAKPRKDHMATVDAAETKEGLTIRRKFARFGALRVLKLATGDTAPAAVNRLAATGRYEFVEPDYVRHATYNPDFSQQWALSNTGANGPGDGVAGDDIHALAAWTNTRTSAAGVIVAVIDTGVRLTHQDLAANLWLNPQENLDGYTGDAHGINTSGNGAGTGNPNDDNGHGTHVSGILGAVGTSGVDTMGVAWQVQIMPLKFLDSSGNGITSNEVTCIDFAISHGANLINASFGSSTYSSSEYTAIQQAGAAGIAFVAAAGNIPEDNDLTPSYPAGYLLDNIVSVGCSDNRDDLSYFTSYGSGLVDLFAPGDTILSLYNTSDTATATLSGTSMSTPLVTGSLALLKAQFGSGETYRQLINRVLNSVDQKANFSGRVQTGGRLDLASSLTSAGDGPFNDNFANRAHLAGSTLTIRSNNAGATREGGEPVIAGSAGGASLWWDWTAPATGTVNITTNNSAYATLLAVYTGTSLAALTPVASAAAPGVGASSVSFGAQAGTTYEITLDGQAAAAGLSILNLSYANDAFASATTLAGASAGITGTNLYATRESGEPKILGNAGGHSLWYKWTPPAAGQYQISVFSPDFDPLLAVYTGSSVNALTLATAGSEGGAISASESTPGSTCTCTLAATAGTTYYITVDGNKTDDSDTGLNAGQFTLTIDDSAWQGSAGDSITCSPAVGADGTVYVGSDDDTFYAFNPNGSTKWSYKTGSSLDTSSSSLSSDGATVYTVSDDGFVYAFAAATGALDWHYAVSTQPPACAPTVAFDGTIYVKDTGSTLYALTPAGALKWTAAISGISYAAPTIGADGTIYLGSDNGNLYALNPATGATEWTFFAAASIYTAAAIDRAGNLYFATLNGTCFAVNSAGNQIWSYQAGNSITSSPVLNATGTVVYFASYDHNLYALSTANGAAQWSYALGGEVRASSPAIDGNGVIYVGCYDNNLYAVNPNGTLNRIYATGDFIRSSPVIANDTLYFGSNDHKLYAFAIGVNSAASPWPTYLHDSTHTGRAPTPLPAVITQPQSQSVNSGQSVTLTASASGAPAYQWQVSTNGGTSFIDVANGTGISGATTPTLALTDVQPAESGIYQVIATNNGGSITIPGAVLTVIPPASLAFTLMPSSQSVATGHSVVFTALAAGFPAPTYQWTLNGTPLSGATDRILVISGTTAANAGAYACLATNTAGSLSSSTATLAVAPSANPGYLTNLSGRGVVGSGLANGVFAGFGISGTGSKQLLIRGIGPGLLVPYPTFVGYLPDPYLTLYNNVPAVIATNDNWGGGSTLVNAQLAVGAYALPSNSLDAMLYFPAPASSYSAEVSGNNSTTGISVIELYDADTALPLPAKLTNVSVRAPVGTGGNILFGGFTIGGSTNETVLIRAIGPGFPSSFGLGGVALQQPVLTLFAGTTPIYSNTVWGGDPALVSAMSTVGAYPLAANTQDSLLLVTLPPGGYSAEVSAANNTTGIAAVEVYELP